MHAIAFVTQKGGAGKSTLAACLAVAAQEAGERVFLVDMDPQGSLLSWGQSRDAETLLVDTITPVKLETALATLAGNGYTLAMIDTAGADTAAAAAAMRAADSDSSRPGRPPSTSARRKRRATPSRRSAASTRSSSTNARPVPGARAPTTARALWS